MLRDTDTQANPFPPLEQTVARNMPPIRVREIAEPDLDQVASLLGRGFQRESYYYSFALARLAQHPTPADFPKFGYLMEVNERVVGAILLIFSTLDNNGSRQVRCNVTGWYVEPEYKSYAALFASRAFRRKNVTYVNISARPAARPIIKAQGFAQYTRGQFVALPALHLTCDTPTTIVAGDKLPFASFEASDRELLAAHAEFGCMAVWCVTAERAYPFVFLPRMFKRCMPGVQLIYCREVGDLVRFAKPIGRYLAARGLFLLSIDANGPIPNMVGRFLKGKSPRFFRGPTCPRIGDIAYTQAAMFPWPPLPHQRGSVLSSRGQTGVSVISPRQPESFGVLHSNKL